MFETREIISEGTVYVYKITVLNTEKGICMPSLIATDYGLRIGEQLKFEYDNPEFLRVEFLNTIEQDLKNGSHSYLEIPREDYLELYAMLCHAKALGWFNE